MTLEYRTLGPGDTAELEHVEHGVFDDPPIEAVTIAFLASPQHHLVVAKDDETVVGFVSAVHYLHPDKPAPELWINEVGIAPSHRRHGIGRQLLEIVLDIGRHIGCREAWVVTEANNEVARRLYDAAGGSEQHKESILVSFEL